MKPQSESERPQRIFIVDDHPLFRMGLRSMLEASGSFVLCGEAEDAQSALSQLRVTPVDLVIIDITLRGASGIELLKQLKAELPELRALLMSMHDEELYAERALRAGAVGYVKKDSPAERVLAAIQRALRGGIVLSASSTEELLHRMVHGKSSKEPSALKSLSDRELEIFALMGQGASTRDCAERLHISVKTIEAHQASIKVKLGMKGAHQLRRYAVLWANPNSPGREGDRAAEAPDKPKLS
jgi:DNA-binding NarL/FixJ family response regulator